MKSVSHTHQSVSHKKILKEQIMNIDNKTILITGLIICSVLALILKNHDVALAIVSGLVGYLSKDPIQNYFDTIDDLGDEDGEDPKDA